MTGDSDHVPIRVSVGRRTFCRNLITSASLIVAGGAVSGCARSLGRTRPDQAALLLPLSGDASPVGEDMARAASLVSVGGVRPLPIFDTKDTVAGSEEAARRAIASGARVLLGPLRAEQTPPVVAIAAAAPVVTFSNDERLAGSGAFVMGVTPAQSVATVFSYARDLGMRRVAVVAAPGDYGDATIDAARRIAAAGGLTLATVRSGDDRGLVSALRAANGGRLPDVAFLPDGGPGRDTRARSLAGSGVQLAGGVQWGMPDPETMPALENSWIAAPAPARFVPFQDAFATQFGAEAGVLAALGYDAALVAYTLSGAGDLDRNGLLREGGFVGALGSFRFRPDGRCQRDLALLTVRGGQILALAEVTGT